MNTPIKRPLTVALALMGMLLSGGALVPIRADTTPPELAAVRGQAVVVFYRDKKLKAGAAQYKTFLNDVPVALLTNGTWAGVVVPPGSYDLWIEMYNPSGLISRAVTLLEVDANRVHFIKEDSYFISKGLTFRAIATSVDDRTGRGEIQGLQEATYLEEPRMPDHSGASRFITINRLPSPGAPYQP